MLVNDSLCNHTSVGKIVMDGRLLSSAVLWLLPITLNDGSFKWGWKSLWGLSFSDRTCLHWRNFVILLSFPAFWMRLNQLRSVISCVIMAKTQISVLLCHLQTVKGSARLPDEHLKRSRLHWVGFFKKYFRLLCMFISDIQVVSIYCMLFYVI